mmetsp:Transcript_13817/g.39425  ORF Transcript_13817/g.39425 Transcript_13817/m.39425 type:complete len:229 (-) Transcript_13817:397-1083(-)
MPWRLRNWPVKGPTAHVWSSSSLPSFVQSDKRTGEPSASMSTATKHRSPKRRAPEATSKFQIWPGNGGELPPWPLHGARFTADETDNLRWKRSERNELLSPLLWLDLPVGNTSSLARLPPTPSASTVAAVRHWPILPKEMMWPVEGSWSQCILSSGRHNPVATPTASASMQNPPWTNCTWPTRKPTLHEALGESSHCPSPTRVPLLIGCPAVKHWPFATCRSEPAALL